MVVAVAVLAEVVLVVVVLAEVVLVVVVLADVVMFDVMMIPCMWPSCHAFHIPTFMMFHVLHYFYVHELPSVMIFR